MKIGAAEEVVVSPLLERFRAGTFRLKQGFAGPRQLDTGLLETADPVAGSNLRPLGLPKIELGGTLFEQASSCYRHPPRYYLEP